MSDTEEPMDTDSNSYVMTHDQSAGSKTTSLDSEQRNDKEQDSNSYVMIHDQSAGSKTTSLDSEQRNAKELPNGTPQKKDTPVATIHLNVVWPENRIPPKWETVLRKALQTWFNKNPRGSVPTECVSVAGLEDGSVELKIKHASGQEDLFTEDTQLTQKDQPTARVRRLNVGGSTPVDNDINPSSLIPSAPPMAESCTVPLVQFCYVNQVYREEMKRIEKENGVYIQNDVTVSFNADPSTGGDPAKALAEFTTLVQSCLGDSNCSTYSHELGPLDWEKTLQFIQRGQEKLTLTVSPHEVEVCGPMQSLKTFETISKMQKKIPNTPSRGPTSARDAQGRSHRVTMNYKDPLLRTGLQVDPAHWVIMTTAFKTKLAELESRFGVKFQYIQDKVKVRAETEMSEDAMTLESHALRALLSLYQRLASSVLSCSLQSLTQVNMVQERLAGLPGVIPDLHADQWRLIGLPEDLRQAVGHIESDAGRPVFKEKDKQRIGHLRYGVDSSGGSDKAGVERPVRGAPAGEEEDKCPVCLDKIKNKATLPCKHAMCTGCLEELKRRMGPTCPICKAIFGKMFGDQPDGRMTTEIQWRSLPGFNGCNMIMIKYEIYSAIQTARHPNPGRRHNSTRREAYLPDNLEGREVLQLLKRAFDQRLIFTVGTSRTSGSDDQVTWNDIHHKTSIGGGPEGFGYADPAYLGRVKEELKAKGIE